MDVANIDEKYKKLAAEYSKVCIKSIEENPLNSF